MVDFESLGQVARAQGYGVIVRGAEIELGSPGGSSEYYDAAQMRELGEMFIAAADLADSIAPPAGSARHWVIGGGMSEAGLNALPVGARVFDNDGDTWTKTQHGWTLNGDDEAVSAVRVMRYEPITLRDLL